MYFQGGFGHEETPFLISGSTLTDICTSAQSLVQSGLGKNEVQQILVEQLIQHLGLGGKHKKAYAGSYEKPGEAEKGRVQQHGMFNVNAKEVIKIVMSMIELRSARRCPQSSQVCTSIAFPGQINLADQQQVQTLFEKLNEIKNSLVNCVV